MSYFPAELNFPQIFAVQKGWMLNNKLCHGVNGDESFYSFSISYSEFKSRSLVTERKDIQISFFPLFTSSGLSVKMTHNI